MKPLLKITYCYDQKMSNIEYNQLFHHKNAKTDQACEVINLKLINKKFYM